MSSRAIMPESDLRRCEECGRNSDEADIESILELLEDDDTRRMNLCGHCIEDRKRTVESAHITNRVRSMDEKGRDFVTEFDRSNAHEYIRAPPESFLKLSEMR